MCQWDDVCVMYGPVYVAWVMYGTVSDIWVMYGPVG